MNIISLTEKRYNEYLQQNGCNSFKQSIEYVKVMEKLGYKKEYVALTDDNDYIIAATLILLEKYISKYDIGYAPNGFLIDFNNVKLLNIFTKKLKEYLKKINVVCLFLDPNFTYKIMNKDYIVLKKDTNILNSMHNLKYKNIKNGKSRYKAILNTKGKTEKEIYNNFNRSLKRKIKENNILNLNIYKENNINKFYELINKKSNKNITYYQYLKDAFNNDNCNFEIYFAEFNPINYLNNYKELYDLEKEKNIELQNLLKNSIINNNIIDNKIKSDKLLNKYKEIINCALTICNNNTSTITISGCAIIKNNNTIYFIEEGYNDKLRNIHTTEILKWEIIKKYINQGYTNFDLGYIPSIDKNNKLYGKTLSKTMFNPSIYEMSGEFELSTSKIYKLTKNNLIKK